jgi:hypothetical protein
MNAGTADGQANAERLAASEQREKRELSAAATELREEREQLRTAVAAASHRLPHTV